MSGPTIFVRKSERAVAHKIVRGEIHGLEWQPEWTVECTFDDEREAARFAARVAKWYAKPKRKC